MLSAGKSLYVDRNLRSQSNSVLNDKIRVVIKCFQPSTKHLRASCVPRSLQMFMVVVAAQGGVRVNLCSREPIFRIIPTPR